MTEKGKVFSLEASSLWALLFTMTIGMATARGYTQQPRSRDHSFFLSGVISMSNNHQTSRAYEEVVEALIQQQMGEIKGIEQLEISRDAHLRGMSGYVHQIDVVYRFRIWRTDFLVLVECKQYSKSVGVDDLLQLKSRMDDLRAQKGLLVSSSGFQQGAITFAKANGISLLRVCGTEVDQVLYCMGAMSPEEECTWERDVLIDSYDLTQSSVSQHVTMDPSHRRLVIAKKGVSVVIEIDELRPDLLFMRPCAYFPGIQREFNFEHHQTGPVKPHKLLKSLVIEELLCSTAD